MKNIINFIIIMFILFGSIYAIEENYSNKEVEISNTNNEHYYGVYGGNIGGVGITYRYWLFNYGFQASIFPLIAHLSISNFNTNYVNLNFGIMGMIKIYDNDWSRIFIHLGTDFNFYNNDESYLFLSSFGPGFDFFINKYIILSLVFGYCHNLSYSHKKLNSSLLTFGGGIGILFKFD